MGVSAWKLEAGRSGMIADGQWQSSPALALELRNHDDDMSIDIEDTKSSFSKNTTRVVHDLHRGVQECQMIRGLLASSLSLPQLHSKSDWRRNLYGLGFNRRQNVRKVTPADWPCELVAQFGIFLGQDRSWVDRLLR